MDKVNIILCTYNGEKYLRVLLDSLLAQTYCNIDIYIRDDGSTDNTPLILKEYENKTVNGISIHLLWDNLGNLGYVKNFLQIIRTSGDADYYAFCDQDDYWLPDKIAHAVEVLQTKPSYKCLLYSSAYETRDTDLNFLRKGHVPTPLEKLDVGKALSLYDGGWLLGFTLVMNKTLKEKAFDNTVQKMYSHDIWVQAVAAGFGGELLYDERVGTYFRRHENTTSIAESNISRSFWIAWRYRWSELLGNGSMFTRLKESMVSYAELYQDKVQRKRDKLFLNCFGNQNGHHRLQKLIYPYRLKQSLLVELAWRLAIFLGKI